MNLPCRRQPGLYIRLGTVALYRTVYLSPCREEPERDRRTLPGVSVMHSPFQEVGAGVPGRRVTRLHHLLLQLSDLRGERVDELAGGVTGSRGARRRVERKREA